MSLKLIIFALVLLVDLQLPAEAHDIYSHLVDSTGKSCCDDKDCRPAPYRVKANGVQMYVDGDWIDVPNHTIQYRVLLGDSGETGGGHWCGFAYRFHPGHLTLCAVLPPNAASAGNFIP